MEGSTTTSTAFKLSTLPQTECPTEGQLQGTKLLQEKMNVNTTTKARVGNSITLSTLRSLAGKYEGGGISHHQKEWNTLTQDRDILNILEQGLSLRLDKTPEPHPPHQHKLSTTDSNIIDQEIMKLLQKRVIIETKVGPTDVFSPIFIRPNKDDTHRMILNLKYLNENIDTHHFKMESIKNALNMVTENCYMASVDLKHAFYTVPIYSAHQKFLKFYWHKPYMFMVMPNGYSDAMRVFTKLLKPPFAHLRAEGYLSVVYVDDSLLVGENYNECRANILRTVSLLQSLGFTVHPDKSVLIPQQRIEFLGFILDSTNMRITLTERKKQKIKQKCLQLLKTPKPNIRVVAQLIGNLVATKEAIPMAPLYYRNLENAKIEALKTAKGNFDKTMPLTVELSTDIPGWVQNIDKTYWSILPLPIDTTVYTDTSKQGWGHTMESHTLKEGGQTQSGKRPT